MNEDEISEKTKVRSFESFRTHKDWSYDANLLFRLSTFYTSHISSL